MKMAARGKASAGKPGTGAQGKAPLTISRPELLVNGSDRQFRNLVDDIFALSERHRAVRDGHAAYIGLSGFEYTVLVALRHLQDEGHLGVSRLAEHLRVSGSFATTMVAKLASRGLVTKGPDPDDARRVLLQVTPEGHALLAKLAPVQRRVNDIQFGCLSGEDFGQFLDLLERMITSSEQAVAMQRYLALGGR
jgi:MarR family transcriptional regulator, organic hydroperoxide resistance regulator